MSSEEMTKAFAIYKNFINFTASIQKEANIIPLLFGFQFKPPTYYKADPKLEKTLQVCMKEKEDGGFYEDNQSDFDLGEMPEFEDDQNNDFAANFEDAKEEQDDDSDSDEDYEVDLLQDIKQAEQFATQAQPQVRSSAPMAAIP